MIRPIRLAMAAVAAPASPTPTADRARTRADGGAAPARARRADPPQRGRGTQFHQRNVQDCRVARNRLATVEAQLSQSAPRLREMEATYNWILGNLAQEEEGNRIGTAAYAQRVRRFGIDVPHNGNPQWIAQQLRGEIDRARQIVGPLEQEAAELRQGMTNINCAY